MPARTRRTAVFSAVVLVAGLLCLPPAAGLAQARAAGPSLSITVSMDRPTAHYYHVVFRASRLKGESSLNSLPITLITSFSIISRKFDLFIPKIYFYRNFQMVYVKSK